MITCGAYPPAIMVCGALVNTVGAGTVVTACIPQPQSKGEIRRLTWFSVRTRLAKPIFRRISHFRYRQKWSVAFRGGKTRLSASLTIKSGRDVDLRTFESHPHAKSARGVQRDGHQVPVLAVRQCRQVEFSLSSGAPK